MSLYNNYASGGSLTYEHLAFLDSELSTCFVCSVSALVKGFWISV